MKAVLRFISPSRTSLTLFYRMPFSFNRQWLVKVWRDSKRCMNQPPLSLSQSSDATVGSSMRCVSSMKPTKKTPHFTPRIIYWNFFMFCSIFEQVPSGLCFAVLGNPRRKQPSDFCTPMIPSTVEPRLPLSFTWVKNVLHQCSLLGWIELGKIRKKALIILMAMTAMATQVKRRAHPKLLFRNKNYPFL